MKIAEVMAKLFASGVGTESEFQAEGLPLWLSKSVRIYLAGEIEREKVLLVMPKIELAFEQLVNIQQQVEKKLGGFVLLIADDLNPKFRGVFVRMGIPFVVRGQAVFAPQLGIKLLELKKRLPVREKILSDLVTPFEVKLIVGFLTSLHKFNSWMNLSGLSGLLGERQYKCSLGKLSCAVNDLLQKKYLVSRGAGPYREFKFIERNEMWKKLQDAEVATLYKRVAGYDLDKKGDVIFSGESALGHFSTLAKPKTEYYAITGPELDAIRAAKSKVLVDDWDRPQIYFDVFREPPKLFSEGNYLNPVELYLYFRNHSDERIQIAVKEMLKSHTSLEV